MLFLPAPGRLHSRSGLTRHRALPPISCIFCENQGPQMLGQELPVSLLHLAPSATSLASGRILLGMDSSSRSHCQVVHKTGLLLQLHPIQLRATVGRISQKFCPTCHCPPPPLPPLLRYRLRDQLLTDLKYCTRPRPGIHLQRRTA